MIAETKPSPVETKPPGIGERYEKVKTELAPRWSEFWTSAIDAAGAECTIVALKAARAMVAGALGVMALIALLALGVYGFVLLDSCFDFSLHAEGMPVWLSPLVRGVLYFGLMAGVFGGVWAYLFGTGEPKDKTIAAVAESEVSRG